MIKKVSFIKVSFIIEESKLKFQLFYTKRSIENCFKRIVKLIYNEIISYKIKRYIIAIAGPPGCGKSSISHLLSNFFYNDFGIKSIVLPLDGFHYPNEYLKSITTIYDNKQVTLYDIKGAPETYNTEMFEKYIKKLFEGDDFYWPIYSRKIHNPVEKGIKISSNTQIFIVEGNYLLLKEKPWINILKYYNKRIFIKAPIRLLKKRVLSRKIAGGYDKKEALRHFYLSDIKNIRRVLKNSDNYHILIKQKGKYHYLISELKSKA